MSDRVQAADALVRQIKAAFADVPYPKDGELVRLESACRPEWIEVQRAFEGKQWLNLPVKFLRYHYDGPCVFTPEAYRYFLPAFLLVSILEPEEADVIPDNVVYDFSSSTEKIDPEHFQKKLAGFTKSELRAIMAFLEYRKGTPDGLDEDIVEIDEALENLRPYL